MKATMMVDDTPARVAGISGAVEVRGDGELVRLNVIGGVAELDEDQVNELFGALAGALATRIWWDGEGNAHRCW